MSILSLVIRKEKKDWPHKPMLTNIFGEENHIENREFFMYRMAELLSK